MAKDEQDERREDDWAAHLSSSLESFVDMLRDRSVRPVRSGVRWLIIGVIGAALGIVFLVVGSIGLVRLLDSDAFHNRVWATYLLLGGIFAIAGVFLLRRSARALKDG